LFGDGPGSSEVCVGPEVDLERFGSIQRLENCTPGSLVSIRIIEERSFEIAADSFYGNLVTASWIVGVSGNLVDSKCEIGTAVVGKIHHEANVAAIVPVFFSRWRIRRA